MVLGTWWAMPGFLQTWRLELRPNGSILVLSDQRILFLTVWDSFRCFFANSKWGFMCFTEGRLLSEHSVLQWWISLWYFPHLHGVLGHLSYQGPSPPIAQFAQAASFGYLVVPNFFHLRIMVATVLLGPFNFLWYVLSAVRPYMDRCVPFQIMFSQLNWPYVDFNKGEETCQRLLR